MALEVAARDTSVRLLPGDGRMRNAVHGCTLGAVAGEEAEAEATAGAADEPAPLTVELTAEPVPLASSAAAWSCS